MIADRIRSIQAVSGGGGGGGGDPYFADRILILNLDGDFSDSGPNAFTVTPYGNAQIVGDGAFGTVASFDGSGDYLESPSHPNFALGLGDFTIEFWVKLADISFFRVMFDARSASTNKVPVIYTNGGKLRYVAEGVERIFGDTMSTGSWYHIAAVRSESQTKLYLNGTQVGNTFADTTDYQQSGFRFGYFPGTPSAAFNGLLGPLTVSKRADYLSNFTPDTWHLTSLILNMQGTAGGTTFIDESPNALAVTRNGDTVLVSDATFGTVASFDGVGDYLTTTSPDITGTWTVEFWWYPTVLSKQQTLIGFNSGSNGGINIWVTSQNKLMVDNGTVAQSAFPNRTFVLNQWHHVAVVRNGSTTTGYINGTAAGSNSFSPIASTIITIGRYTASEPFNPYGRIGPLSITEGFARYTANFTPPTGLFPTS